MFPSSSCACTSMWLRPWLLQHFATGQTIKLSEIPRSPLHCMYIHVAETLIAAPLCHRPDHKAIWNTTLPSLSWACTSKSLRPWFLQHFATGQTIKPLKYHVHCSTLPHVRPWSYPKALRKIIKHLVLHRPGTLCLDRALKTAGSEVLFLSYVAKSS